MGPEEYRAKKEKVARTLQRCWMRDGSVIGVLRLLVSELGPRDDLGAIAFGVVGCMHDAFDMSLGEAKRISRWREIGGDLSDEEIEHRIGTLVPRDLGS